MNKSDRRYSARYAMKTPIRFRMMETLSEPEGYRGETTNISRTGVFFVTNVPLQLGSVPLLALRVPESSPGVQVRKCSAWGGWSEWNISRMAASAAEHASTCATVRLLQERRVKWSRQ